MRKQGPGIIPGPGNLRIESQPPTCTPRKNPTWTQEIPGPALRPERLTLTDVIYYWLISFHMPIITVYFRCHHFMPASGLILLRHYAAYFCHLMTFRCHAAFLSFIDKLVMRMPPMVITFSLVSRHWLSFSLIITLSSLLTDWAFCRQCFLHFLIFHYADAIIDATPYAPLSHFVSSLLLCRAADCHFSSLINIEDMPLISLSFWL